MVASAGLSWTVEDTVVVMSPLLCRSLTRYEYVAHSLRKFIVNVHDVFSQHVEHLLRRQMLCLLISNDCILSQHMKIDMSANSCCFIGYLAIVSAPPYIRVLEGSSQNNYIISVLFSRVWISLKAVEASEGLIWKWNEETELTYSAWHTDYPKLPFGCAYISNYGVDHWMNINCDSKQYVLCERRFIGKMLGV